MHVSAYAGQVTGPKHGAFLYLLNIPDNPKR